MQTARHLGEQPLAIAARVVARLDGDERQHERLPSPLGPVDLANQLPSRRVVQPRAPGATHRARRRTIGQRLLAIEPGVRPLARAGLAIGERGLAIGPGIHSAAGSHPAVLQGLHPVRGGCPARHLRAAAA